MSSIRVNSRLTAALVIILTVVGCSGSPERGTQTSTSMRSAPATPAKTRPRPVDVAAIRRQAKERSQKHLDWADQECRRRIHDSEAQVEAFFTQAKQGVPGFAKAALGWSSKWRLAVDYVPFTRHDRHPAFLREQFARHIFAPEQFAEAVQQAVKQYLAAVSDVENQMLVRMRADMADLPQEVLPAIASDDRLRSKFAQALAEVRGQVAKDLAGDVGRLVASEVAAQVAMQVAAGVLESAAARLGVSGGILAAGAETSWVTLGVGLAVGIVVDWIVGKLWDHYADPQGQIAESLVDNLDQLKDTILQGDGQHPGLRQALARLAQSRDRLRRAAVFKLLEGNRKE
jgi:hypothetical protein